MVAPSAFENGVQHDHRHVTAHAITLLRNGRDGLNHRLSKARLKCAKLQTVGPSWKVRVPSARAYSSADPNIGGGTVPNVVGITSYEVLRVLGGPRMIRRHTVGNEVQDQVHAPFRELSSGNGKTLGTSKVLVNYIAAHTIGGSHVVLNTKVRKCSPKILKQALILIGNGNAGRTSFPDSHQPDRIQTKRSNGIPFG